MRYLSEIGGQKITTDTRLWILKIYGHRSRDLVKQPGSSFLLPNQINRSLLILTLCLRPPAKKTKQAHIVLLLVPTPLTRNWQSYLPLKNDWLVIRANVEHTMSRPSSSPKRLCGDTPSHAATGFKLQRSQKQNTCVLKSKTRQSWHGRIQK